MSSITPPNNGSGPAHGARPVREARVSVRDNAEVANWSKSAVVENRDTVEVSATKELQDLAASLAAGESREAAIAKLKAAVKAGDYKVDANALAERLLDEHALDRSEDS